MTGMRAYDGPAAARELFEEQERDDREATEDANALSVEVDRGRTRAEAVRWAVTAWAA